MKCWAAGVALGALGAFAFAPQANATTVEYVSAFDTINVGAASGETNDIKVKSGAIDDQYIVTDSGSGTSLNAAGTGCTKVGSEVRCDAPDLQEVDFDLADLADSFDSTGLAAAIAVGGTGGTGANQITAGPGGDVFHLSQGNDTVDGGGGEDLVDYSGINTGVSVNLANETATGGGTDSLVNIEDAVGGSGNDTLIGDNLANFLNGLDGDDTINGSGAVEPAADSADQLIGNDGDDTLIGQGGDDSIEGGNDTDTVKYSTSNGIVADLQLSTGSDGFGGTDVLSEIENLDGSRGIDMISGSSGPNVIDGGESPDFIQGRGGDDFLQGGTGPSGQTDPPENDYVSFGGSANLVTADLSVVDPQATGEGNDTIRGFENIIGSPQEDHLTGDGGPNVLAGAGGPDVLNGAGGDDILRGGADFDVLVGDTGTDTASYTDATDPIEADLAAGTVTVGSTQDSLPSNDVENVFGSPNDDTIQGSSGANALDGAGGDDLIEGRGGNDSLTGGPGTLDLLTYNGAPTGISANLGTGSVSDGYGGTDTIVSGFEAVQGSTHDDSLVGSSGADDLRGGDGNDTFEGKGGVDTFSGGNGSDTASYLSAAAGVTVSTGANGATDDGDGSTDNTFDSVENITGSALADDLSGTSLANTLNGAGGDDVLFGQRGDDSYIGGSGSDTVLFLPVNASGNGPVTANLAAGTATGEGSDTLSGVENLTGTNGDDTLTGDGNANDLDGNMGADTLRGGGGNDVLGGGDGTDTVSYSTAVGSVTADLDSAQASNDGDGGSDTFGSIEKLIGSPNADTLTGRSLANDISALGGNDLIRVRNAVADTVDCGAGTDHVVTDPLDSALTGCEVNDDPSPPSTPAITGSNPGSGSNDNQPEIKGTALGGSTVTLYAAAGCTGTPLASGSAATFAGAGLTIQVADDSTTTVYAALSTPDDVDSPSACSRGYTYVESTPVVVPPPPATDTTAPDTTIDKLLKKTKDTTPTFKFSSTEAGSTFECRVDKGSFAPCESPFTTKKLKKGSHTIEVRGIDAAGNVDQTPARNKFKVKPKKRRK